MITIANDRGPQLFSSNNYILADNAASISGIHNNAANKAIIAKLAVKIREASWFKEGTKHLPKNKEFNRWGQ